MLSKTEEGDRSANTFSLPSGPPAAGGSLLDDEMVAE
jgi:hypothetical protein